MADTQYLERHGETWRYVRRVKGKLVRRNLGTDSLREAQRMRDHFHATGRWTPVGDISAELAPLRTITGALPVGLVKERAEELRQAGEPEKANLLRIAAHGGETLESALTRWHARVGKSLKDRTRSDHRTAVERLGQWLIASRKGAHLIKPDGKPLLIRGAFVQLVTPDTAADYGEHLERTCNGRTANKHVSSLRSLWKFLRITPNPWQGVTVPEVTSESVAERPFTDSEVARLLAGGGDAVMLDVLRLGLLTGARLEEIFQLRVSDVDGQFLQIRNSKRRGAVTRRPVAVHPELAPVIARRTEGKSADEFLIHEAQATGWDGARSMAFSKRFRTYRERCRVAETVEGQRRSKVNFHSCRRWTANQFEVNGVSELIAARILGHKIRSLSYGVYSQGGNLEEIRKAIESLKLPS